MRVLLLNANTNPAMTEHCLVAARAYAPDIDFSGATGRFGSPHIGTRATYAIAAYAAFDAYAAQAQGFDAAILACFGDPGLAALKEIADVPVVGLAEAACRAASRRQQPFSIVTGGARWAPMLMDYLMPLGLTKHLASIRTVDVTGSQIMADPDHSIEKLAQACRAAVAQDGAQSVILGGAGLVGLAPRVQSKVPVPVADCLEPAIDEARTAVRESPSRSVIETASAGTFPGVSAELARLLQADIANDRSTGRLD